MFCFTYSVHSLYSHKLNLIILLELVQLLFVVRVCRLFLDGHRVNQFFTTFGDLESSVTIKTSHVYIS